MDSEEVKSCSNLIVQSIRKSDAYRFSKRIALYYPYKNEVDLMSLLDDGNKIFCFPVVKENSRVLCFRAVKSMRDFVSGAYGIKEPSSLCQEVAVSEVDLFLTPGVAFSETGERIGYGGGYYDATLPLRKKEAKAIGVALDFQILSSGFSDERDVPVDGVITEKRQLLFYEQIKEGEEQ